MESTSRPSHPKRRKPKIEWPDWLSKPLKILKPPENITVSECAQKHRVLDPKTSNESGPWNNARTPYLVAIMDAFNDPDIEEIVFVKPTQVGGTEGLNNIIDYIGLQDPSPTMVVYPTEALAKYTSENRLQPMIRLIPELYKKYWENDSKQLELQFDDMYIVLSGANSPTSLGSKPIRFLLFDEVDKYPLQAGKEADPRSLARQRTDTYPYNKKIFQTSTPTYKHRPIWQEWLNADQQLKYFVPCPHCGHKQTFEFGQIKYNKESPATAQMTAYYECKECNGIINDSHKATMVANGSWEAIKKNGTKITAFHLNAIYSPWKRFGDVAYEYEKSKNDPKLHMNFVNSWLGLPYEQTEVKMSTDIVLERESEFERNIIPDGTMLLTGGIDVQKDHFYWTIRAWGKSITSWNVAHGVVGSYAELEDVMNRSYFDKKGDEFIVNLCAMDSGFNTDEVYEFCVLNRDWLIPVKGSSKPLVKRYTESVIDKPDSSANGMSLYIVDGAQYKDTISTRILKPNGPGSWMIYKGCDRKYADHITAEEKLKIKKCEDYIYIWKLKDGEDNHWLDAEVYAFVAADILKVRYLGVDDDEKPQEEPQKQQHHADDYINANSNWIPRKDGWLG
jgi:phage terminase large subunit GpA-like protein